MLIYWGEEAGPVIETEKKKMANEIRGKAGESGLPDVK